mgnify:CR=1 FL=1
MLWPILRLINSINYGKESLDQWQLFLFAHRLAEDCLFFISAESSFPIDHFWVSLSLFFKASLRAESLLWKSGFIHDEISTNDHANKNFALRLALKERLRGAPKWSIHRPRNHVTYWHCIVLSAISEILSLILRSFGLKIRDLTRKKNCGASLKLLPPNDLANTISLMALLERRKLRRTISLWCHLLLLLGFEFENR